MSDEHPTDQEAARRRPGRPAIGRTTPLTLEAILAEALTIIRRDGFDALSNRRLAAALGVTPNALYRYVPGKRKLLELLVSGIWNEILNGVAAPFDDRREWLVQTMLRTRRVWIDNIELAALAMAVVPADEGLIMGGAVMAEIAASVGFEDVPGGYYAIQTLTLGSVAVTAARRNGSAYFERDPDEVLAAAGAMLDALDASPNVRGVIEARFDVGDERHFEATLRLLVGALVPTEREGVAEGA